MIMTVFHPNDTPLLEEQIRARGQKLLENHSQEEIKKTIIKVKELDTRESAVTVDVLTTMMTGKA